MRTLQRLLPLLLAFFLFGSAPAGAQTGAQTVQLLLREAGCDPGPIDGVIGRQTIDALRTCLELPQRRQRAADPAAALGALRQHQAPQAQTGADHEQRVRRLMAIPGMSRAAAEATARLYPDLPPRRSAVSRPCAENGSCYGDISAETRRPKTVRVRGYYRSDGTYVRGHYRSAPRR